MRGRIAGLALLALAACKSEKKGGLSWEPCPGGIDYECAMLEVPLDYSDPSAGTVETWAARKPAADPANRIGVLVSIPGGPGGGAIENAGVQIFQFLASAPVLVDRFDLVFIDRRGTGLSGPLTCGTDAIFDTVRHTRFEPQNAAEWTAVADAWTAFGAACGAAHSPGYLRSLSTDNYARDIDAWREALGEEEISLIGFSYGTLAVADYAQLFPDRVRAGVADAMLAWYPDLFEGSWSIGDRTDAQLDDFFAACSADSTCEFHGGDTPANIAAAYDALEAQLLVDPPEMVSTWQVGPRDLADQMYNLLRNGDVQGSLHSVAQALAAAESGNWTPIVTGAGGTGGGYDLDSQAAFYAIILADLPCAFTDAAGAEAAMPAVIGAAPRLGMIRGSRAFSCIGWPATRTEPHVHGATTAPPLLIAGGANDTVSALVSAQTVTTALANGSHLLRYDGFTHPFFGADACVQTETRNYLVDPAAYALPASGSCP